MASLPFELKGKTVYVPGHRGMVGSALVRRLAREGVQLQTATRSEADLRHQAAVNRWFAAKRPQVVFLAAAKVGGLSPTTRCALNSSMTIWRLRPT
jgi:GDP-L-fucose synthase